MSMPWILASHILETKNQSLMDYVWMKVSTRFSFIPIVVFSLSLSSKIRLLSTWLEQRCGYEWIDHILLASLVRRGRGRGRGQLVLRSVCLHIEWENISLLQTNGRVHPTRQEISTRNCDTISIIILNIAHLYDRPNLVHSFEDIHPHLSESLLPNNKNNLILEKNKRKRLCIIIVVLSGLKNTAGNHGSRERLEGMKRQNLNMGLKVYVLFEYKK